MCIFNNGDLLFKLTVIGERDCSNKAQTNNITGAIPVNLDKAIIEYGYEFESKRKGFDTDKILSYDDEEEFSKYLRNSLKNNESVIILSNDWGR